MLILVGADAVAGQEFASGTPDMLTRRVANSGRRLQPVPVTGNLLDPHFLAHASRFASKPPDGFIWFRRNTCETHAALVIAALHAVIWLINAVICRSPFVETIEEIRILTHSFHVRNLPIL